MESKYGFKKMNLEEFKEYITELQVARTVLTIQQHHTYSPSYKHFKGDNHFTLQRNMKNYHVNQNGWSDIGQHFSTFTDGTIVTGRSIERSPACIYGANSNSVCIEHVGNFDAGGDAMSEAHKATIIGMTAALCEKFEVPVNTDKVIYHHWYNLSTGKRNNGSGGNKSCPGTNFFGGNKVEDAQQHFIPLVEGALSGNINNHQDLPHFMKYVVVTADKLNVREGASASTAINCDRESAVGGAILRVYGEDNGWYRISSKLHQWVYGRYTKDVERATITTEKLNVRSGPSTDFEDIGDYFKGQEVFIEERSGNWAKVVMEEAWVHAGYLSFSNS
ncbi:MAG: SH3 domain-containing protein [Bacteroidota bacterium]